MPTIPERPAEPPWRLRLMLATSLAVLLIAAVLVGAVVNRSEVSRRREALLAALEGLSEAQEDALARDGQYAAHLAQNGGMDTARFVPPPGISITFERLGATAWRAVVRDSALSIGPRSCGIFRGEADASPHRAVVNPGIPACW